jgi:hypothetical protein
MKKNLVLPIFILVVVAIALALVFWMKFDTKKAMIETPVEETEEEITEETLEEATPEVRTPTEPICVGEYCDGSMSGDDYLEKYTVLQIPLTADGGTIGCGAKIVFAPHAVSKTRGVMDATYKLLFDLKPSSEIVEDGLRNVVGAYTHLFYDSVTLKNGTAKLYLSGSMYGPGHCAEPELRAQIEQGALQFETVNKLEVYLNGELFNWCEMDMSDGEGPCPEQPQYWVVSK